VTLLWYVTYSPWTHCQLSQSVDRCPFLPTAPPLALECVSSGLDAAGHRRTLPTAQPSIALTSRASNVGSGTRRSTSSTVSPRRSTCPSPPCSRRSARGSGGLNARARRVPSGPGPVASAAARLGISVGAHSYPDRVFKLARRQAPATSAKSARIRLLSAELDESRRAAVERSRTNDTKASFLVVAAGFLAAITGSELVEARTWFVGILPLLFTLATVVVAAVVLWPRRLSVPSGPEMVAAWVNADMTAEDLEDHILEVKSKEVKNRNEQNERKAELTSWGFSLLIAAMASALVVVVVDAVVRT